MGRTEQYEIREQTGAGRTLQVNITAHSHEEAANLWNGLGARWAVRVTGENGKNGCFQGYKRLKTGGVTSVGPQFHVSRQ